MPVVDNYLGSHNRTDPLVGGEAVDISSTDHTPSQVSRAIWIEGEGDLKVTMKDGSIVTWPTLSAGVWHPLRVKLVWRTGTTATGIRIGW